MLFSPLLSIMANLIRSTEVLTATKWCPMHELSIAVNLVDIAAAEAARHSAERVRRVFVRVGDLSGVVPDALRFAFDVAIENTALSGATLEIERVRATVYCAMCLAERELSDLFALCCPDCGAESADLRGGRELELAALELI